MKLRKIFWGVFFILASVVVILNQLGYGFGINLVSLLLSILLLSIFFKSLKSLSFFGMIMPIALIVVIYSQELGIQSLTPWPIIVSGALLSIGLEIVFGARRHNYYNNGHFVKNKHNKEFIEERIDSDSENINIYTSFGATTKFINSQNINKIDATLKFGACKIYLDKAKLNNNAAVLNIDSSFGGMEIYIPKEWSVVNNIACSLGVVDEKNKNEGLNDIILTLDGRCSFSGIEIIYV